MIGRNIGRDQLDNLECAEYMKKVTLLRGARTEDGIHRTVLNWRAWGAWLKEAAAVGVLAATTVIALGRPWHRARRLVFARPIHSLVVGSLGFTDAYYLVLAPH